MIYISPNGHSHKLKLSIHPLLPNSSRNCHCDLMSCDVKPLVVRILCLSIYCIHTTVIQQDISRGKIIPKIIFTFFVNLRKDSPAYILFAFKERLDHLDNKLVYQTQVDLGAETILEQVSNSDQQQV